MNKLIVQEDQVTFNDLVNPNHYLFYKNNDFGSWKEVFVGHYDPKWRKGIKKITSLVVMKIVKVFLDVLIDDLIDNNEIFCFPSGNKMRLYIGINNN